MLSKEPILKAPYLSEPFILRTDASSTRTGPVLLQRHEGIAQAVEYVSRRLLPREAAYLNIEREGLALVWAVKKFNVYLSGKPFILQSDHQPLAYINSAQHINTRVLWWRFTLMEYDCVGIYQW